MADKLSALRSLMKSHSLPLVALVVSFRRLSSGLALITMNDARLWTDGSYFLQAEKQLNDQWKLMRIGEDPAVEIWMADNLSETAAIGVDPWSISIETAQRWEQAFLRKQQKLVQTLANLIDQIWKDRPAAEVKPVIVQPLEFAGRIFADMLQDLRAKLAHEKACGIIVSALDENHVEMEGFKKAHVRDGAVVVQFLVWLDNQMQKLYRAPGYFSEAETERRIPSDPQKLTEVSVSDKLESSVHQRSILGV